MGTYAQPTTNAAFRKFAEGLDTATLFEIERQLTELEGTPGWTVVTTMLGMARETLIENLTKGVLDHATYANRAGYIGGLKEPGTAIETVRTVAQSRREEETAKAEADRQQREGESQ